ncbi:MAG TPA: AMP-binding protein [Myxococcales bacterium]|nr:AMP-binding protein [Myxococcales bacterium]
MDEEPAAGAHVDAGAQAASTLPRLFLRAMRTHHRPAVLLSRDGARWREMPDWRFERQVIRLGLFLRDRAALAPGDRVAVVSSLRPELAVAEFAAAVQGATSVAIDPGLPADQLVLALTAAAPAAIVLERASVREQIGSTQRAVLAMDGRPHDGWMWSEVLDLGGTLDTPERAQQFRARAREILADAPALGHVIARDGAVQCQFISQADAVARVNAVWADAAPAQGDVTYVSGPVTLGARVACLAAVTDGVTRCAFGTPGSETAEAIELRPRRIVASADVADRARRAVAATAPPPAQSTAARRVLEWLRARTERVDRKQ